MAHQNQTLLGKFRGVVTDNDDPQHRGRIRARVPDVFGQEQSGWALPATPFAGQGLGLFLIPPKDALVWIEFEQGDIEFPIWSGCFWEEGAAPVDDGDPGVKQLKTKIGTITLDETDGGGSITIETGSGMRVVLNDNGIELNNGFATLKLQGQTISLNDTALEVT